jgi:hypothetical protein
VKLKTWFEPSWGSLQFLLQNHGLLKVKDPKLLLLLLLLLLLVGL